MIRYESFDKEIGNKMCFKESHLFMGSVPENSVSSCDVDGSF